MSARFSLVPTGPTEATEAPAATRAKTPTESCDDRKGW